MCGKVGPAIQISCVMTLAIEFLEAATIHGLVYVASDSCIIRLFWLCVVISDIASKLLLVTVLRNFDLKFYLCDIIVMSVFCGRMWLIKWDFHVKLSL